MSLLQNRKKIILIAISILVFLIVAIWFIYAMIQAGNRQQISRRNVPKQEASAPPNPSPLNPTTSPTLAEAHKEEIEYMKKHGKYFKLDFNNTEQDNVTDIEDQVVVRAIKQSQETEQKNNMLWQYFWQQASQEIDQNTRSRGMILSLHGKPAEVKQTKKESHYPCRVEAVTTSAVHAVVNKEFPLRLQVVSSSGECAFSLPIGSVLNGSVKADFDIMRAIATLHSVVLPNGKVLPFKGYLLGPDNEYGIGLKVIKNYNKYILLSAIMGGISTGFKTARQVEEANARGATKTQCYEWGCETTEEVVKRNATREGLIAGGEYIFNSLTQGILKYLGRRSPIVVTIPAGYPVVVVPSGA